MDPKQPDNKTDEVPEAEPAAAEETRPLVDDLADVDDEEHVLRFVPWSAWRDNPPDGRYVTEAFVQSKEYGPADDSYGPSVWIESVLLKLGGVPALEAIDARLVHKGIVRVPVKEVRACLIKVKASPHDTIPPFAAFKSAHASFVGIDDDKRDDLLDRCQKYIFRPPPNGGRKPGT